LINLTEHLLTLNNLLAQVKPVEEKYYRAWCALGEKEFPLHAPDGQIVLRHQYKHKPSDEYKKAHAIYTEAHFYRTRLDSAIKELEAFIKITPQN